MEKLSLNSITAAAGLTTRDGKTPDWFEVAGDDENFVKANAEITGKDTVTVWSDEVAKPPNSTTRLGQRCNTKPDEHRRPADTCFQQ